MNKQEQERRVRRCSQRYPKGSYITTTWDNGRCIIKVDEFAMRNEASLIRGEYGINADNVLLLNHEFGLNDNSIRYATESEIDALEKAKDAFNVSIIGTIDKMSLASLQCLKAYINDKIREHETD